MDYTSQTLASLVSDHYQVAPLFEKLHLDFCCKGQQTLKTACEQKGLDIQQVITELDALISTSKKENVDFDKMEAAQLIQYILLHHHFYVKQTIPQLAAYLNKIVLKHGDKFPNMGRVSTLFRTLSIELLSHLEKEEQVLFPAIISMASGEAISIPLKNIIERMLTEHDDAGEMMEQIRILTLDYTPPENVCTTFQLTLTMLKDFESNLHKHVHLENNHLFPMAVRLMQPVCALKQIY